MPAPISAAFGRFGRAVREFTVAQRTVAIIGIAVLVLGIAALAMWAVKPNYTPLFSGLSGADASTIVEQLSTDGVPYELSDGGATILVPEADVYDQRLKSAAAGLPSDSTGGYSLLDTMGVTSSEFQQSVTYKRAIEGELARTISSLDGVQTASVRLAIPEASVFVSETNDPTASVFVQTKSGVTLSSSQVQAIVHLTSASIDGMKSSDVAVVDAAGTVLSAVGVGATGTAGQQASDYETRVSGAVQTMLNRVVGAGNATVVVTADMSTESASRVEEVFTTPEDAPALTETVDTETYAGTGGGAAGVLGPDNIAVPDGATGDGTFASESTVRDNAINKVTESRTIPAGAVTRQTVSVAINADAAANVNLADLTALVSTAAGIDVIRGDAVTVEAIAFDTTAADAAAAAIAAGTAAEASARLVQMVTVGIIAVSILLAIVAGLVIYARRSKRMSRESLDIGDLAGERGALGAPTVALSLEGIDAPLELAPVVVPIVREPSITDQQRADIDALALRDPQKTAEYLRTLMDDREMA
ncbi:flagellar M-ring protein FliF [Cryobacterium sp. TMS1-20-1]|uniref:flagellar basal-body MS-ring/collar protein FliF n=1 Tax=Cryobacterium sp. TMS1-20-1 TaxID=1259223 RepID=UPI00106A4E46|nr:flagellar basal-body MS-ring/collar protein FliF [Cryobacterium sp. TMS1-20-1]TFC75586.1 flagellar M-ring protein FliF [Cryobacterium sp. TMS1-20-1]